MFNATSPTSAEPFPRTTAAGAARGAPPATAKRAPPRVAAVAAGIALVAALVAATPGAARGDDDHRRAQPAALRTEQAIDLRNQLRKLWEDHVVWTRMVIVSLAAGLPDLAFDVDRLLRNQDDIGAAFQPFFGAASAQELTALLHAHIAGAADLLTAAKAGDAGAVAAASARWYANGREIAGLLHRINPRQWAQDEMEEMMKEHLDLTLAEAVARLQGDFAGDIAAYDVVHLAILDMADMLSFGIIRAFPRRF